MIRYGLELTITLSPWIHTLTSIAEWLHVNGTIMTKFQLITTHDVLGMTPFKAVYYSTYKLHFWHLCSEECHIHARSNYIPTLLIVIFT